MTKKIPYSELQKDMKDSHSYSAPKKKKKTGKSMGLSKSMMKKK